MSTRYPSRGGDDPTRAIRHVQDSDEGNRHCADCGVPNPDFMNLTIGTFVCATCADVHRSTTNRRIKDIFSRDITEEDVRRMRDVGNEVANRKFLARWNPHEFPAPNPTDKEGLREFIWLKYEGSWKRASANVGQPSFTSRGAVAPIARNSDFSVRGVSQQPYDAPGFAGYGRERAIFRDGGRPPEPSRSYWADKYAPAPPPPQAPPGRYAEESYYRPPVQHPEYHRAPARHRYEESVDEEYQYLESDRRRPSRRDDTLETDGEKYMKRSKNAARKSQSAYADDNESADDSSTDDNPRRTKKISKKKSSSSSRKANTSPKAPSKTKSKSKSKSAKYNDSDSDSEERDSRPTAQSRKKSNRSGKKAADMRKHSSLRSESDESSESSAGSSEDDSSIDSSNVRRSAKESRKASTKNERRRKKSTGRDADNPFASDSDQEESRKGHGAKTSGKRSEQATSEQNSKSEFDLMSDWMGTETDATTNVSASTQSIPAVGQSGVANAQQPQIMPSVMPPMSVYPGMMFPGGGMMMAPGLSAGLPGAVPMMQPMGMGALMPGMSPMMGTPATGMSPALPNGFVHGMQNLSMQPSLAPPPPHQTAEFHHPPKPPAGPPPP